MESQIGTPLGLVDSSEIKAALIKFPLIETYSVESRPPHGLTIRIVERTPIGVIASDAGYSLVDAAGVVLSTQAAPPEGIPLLEVPPGTDSAVFQSLALSLRTLPSDLLSQISVVHANTRDDVTFTLTSGSTVMWGSEEEAVVKVETLQGALALYPGRQHYDVSARGLLAMSSD